MNKPLLVAPLLVVSLLLVGCSNPSTEDIEGSKPGENTNQTTGETPEEEFTDPIGNDIVEIVPRSLSDFNSFYETINSTIASIDKTGIAQTETGLYGDSVNVFDASRKAEERGITIYEKDSDDPIVLPMSEEILSSARTFNGFFRIDLLINELDAIKGILDFDLTSPNGATAADYENMTTANGFIYQSPGMDAEVSVTVKNGKIVKIVDTYSEGSVIYEFDYNLDNYSDYFEKLN
jgi:major membrane immunogen (membrane-anchored lipoprotein)